MIEKKIINNNNNKKKIIINIKKEIHMKRKNK